MATMNVIAMAVVAVVVVTLLAVVVVVLLIVFRRDRHHFVTVCHCDPRHGFLLVRLISR